MYKSAGPDITFNGKSVQVFPFWPNYRRDFIERWEWKTDVIRAFNGDEQRIRLRQHPRRIFEYEVFARRTDRAALENYLWAGQTQLFAVPVWNSGFKLTPETIQNVTTNIVPIPGVQFTVGGYAVGFLSPNRHETHKVVGKSVDGIQLEGWADWPAGTTVYPLLNGLLNQQQGVTRVTGDFTYAVVTFNLMPGPSRYKGVSPGFPDYRGYPVLEDILDWSQGVHTDFEYKTAVYDPLTNTSMIDVESETPSISQPATWFLKNKSSIHNFLEFAHSCNGRQKPFWMPSGTVDLVPTVIAGNQLIARDSGYTRFIVDTSSRSHIRILLKNHQVIYRKILSAVASSGTETFTLDSQLTISASDILMISFMSLARFDNDRIELAYKGPTFAMSTNLIRTLKHNI